MTQDHKAKMAPRADAPPGIETDGHGNVIPLSQRTPEDQAKAKGQSTKNPQDEAENPAPMPPSQQGDSKS